MTCVRWLLLRLRCKRVHRVWLLSQMPEPRFDGIEAVIIDVEETRRVWNTYKEYQSELAQIRGQDWITFRARIPDLTVRHACDFSSSDVY